MSNLKPETIDGFKDTGASISGIKEEALEILSTITYKSKPSFEDMPKLNKVVKLIQGINL